MKHTIKFANWFSRWNDWSGILSISVFTAVFVIVMVLLLSLKRKKYLLSKKHFYQMRFRNGNAKEATLAHNWHVIDLFSKPTYCNVCETLMVSGVVCVCCNLYADEKCLKKADKQFKCKQIFDNSPVASIDDEQLKMLKRKWHHLWIRGNLKLHNVCFVCKEADCGSEPHLSDYKCVWCLRCVHENCLNSVSTATVVDECDFGQFRRLVLKPNFLTLVRQSNNFTLMDIKLNTELLDRSLNDDWTPLIVFANPKSGSNDAEHLVSMLTTILNPLQIVEMNKSDVCIALKWIEAYSHQVRFKILVCGGDGSVGWILDEISKLQFKKYRPGIGILPLGTGNDLSRVLDWGEGYIGDVDIEDILTEVDKAEYINLDRWQVKIEKNSSSFKFKNDSSQVKYMNNYISVGCDALVTLNFHRQRNKLFFANRLLNKLIYFKYGTIDTFLKECRTLTENIELIMDGKVIKLPHLESIVVLNIPYWGGGVDPWNIGGKSDIPKPSINDGLLEVFGIYSSFHIARLQVGLAEPFRIGQAKEVTIKLRKNFPVQIDGEPWEQSPATVHISLYNQANMLKKCPHSHT